MDELLFYTVDAKYIKYLSEFETHVSYNKNEIGHSRLYLGIVIKVEDYEYFVPLYSYKEHYKKYKNNASFFFMGKYKNVKLIRSKTINEEYVANICEYCGCL